MLEAAGDLFYRHGIRAVGVEAIAEAAGTNKMTLYRHFASKDELVAEYLRAVRQGRRRLLGARSRRSIRAIRWRSFAPGSRRWPRTSPAADERGCPLANAAVELPEKGHPARRVIEEAKAALRSRLIRLCGEAGLSEPEMLADELHLLLEGARVTAQSVGSDGLDARLIRMGEAMIASHSPR